MPALFARRPPPAPSTDNVRVALIFRSSCIFAISLAHSVSHILNASAAAVRAADTLSSSNFGSSYSMFATPPIWLIRDLNALSKNRCLSCLPSQTLVKFGRRMRQCLVPAEDVHSNQMNHPCRHPCQQCLQLTSRLLNQHHITIGHLQSMLT